MLEEVRADSHVIYPVAAPSIAMEDIRWTEEQVLRLAVDPAGFHFDLETGARLPARRRRSRAP